MNKKITAIIAAVVIVAVVASVGVIFPTNSPPKININYASKYGNTQYSNNNTYILFYLNVTTTKNCQFDFGTLGLTFNGQPITAIQTTNTDKIDLKSGQINQWQLDYTVQDDMTGNFQLTYNGTAQVTLSGTDSVPVQS